MIEKSLVLVKPDGVKRALIGEIIKRFEQRGLKIIGMKMVHVDEDFAKKHYREDIAERHGEKVRNMLLDYITEDPIVAMCVEGIGAVSVVRKIVGSTYPNESNIGTIRGDFAHMSKEYAAKEDAQVKNLIHASGTKEEADYEVGLWFRNNELHKYKSCHEDEIF